MDLSAYPVYLKPFHIQEVTQYCKTTTYELIEEMEHYQQTHSLPEKLVYRRPSGRGVRINRDGFFKWFANRENMASKDELRGA